MGSKVEKVQMELGYILMKIVRLKLAWYLKAIRLSLKQVLFLSEKIKKIELYISLILKC